MPTTTLSATTAPATTVPTPTGHGAATDGGHSLDPRTVTRRALTALDGLVVTLRPDDRRRPTPCAGWAVADLLAHLTDELAWLAGALDPAAPAPARRDWSTVVAAADRALPTADLGRGVSTSVGELVVHELLREVTCDLVVHHWDLAVAIGVAPALGDDLVAIARRWFEDLAPGWRAAGRLGPTVAVPPDAPALDRLVARAGRRPVGPEVVRTQTDAAGLGTVVGVWAHPDDESYLSAGLMALARQAGNRVVCVTATLGERGTDDPAWTPRRLAHLRAAELRRALAALDVREQRVLGFADGALPAVDPAVGVQRVVEVLDAVRPDTIVTFGPDGMTGHDDHRTVSAWTTAAWRATGCRARLLYATTTAEFARRFADVHARLPVFGPGLPLRREHQHLDLVVQPDDEVLDAKVAALRAHASQTTRLEAELGTDRFRAWWASESFREPGALALTAPLPTTAATAAGR